MADEAAVAEATNVTPEETQGRVISKRAQSKGRKKVAKHFNTLERLEVSYLPIEAIQPNDWNPNRQSDHDFELLLRSMEEDGFTQPIIVIPLEAEGKYMVVDGEHRWRGAQALGLDEIPVVVVEMSPEQARISTIRHNRARGSHDIELEADLLRDLQRLGAMEWAQDSLLISDEELSRLVDDVSAAEAMANEDFSEAWVPDDFSDEDAALIRGEGMSTEQVVISTGGNENEKVVTAMSANAIEQARRREELLKKAKTIADRQQADRETKLFRISLMFGGEEAKIVRKVLGNRPAERILEMCRAELEE